MVIKSVANDRIKDIKKLISTSKYRKQRELYVVEGIRMFREIPSEELECVVVSEKAYEGVKAEVETSPHLLLVADHVFSSLSDTVTPQGILALVKQKTYSIDDINDNNASLVFVLEHIQDPGNLGTIIRTAEAVGASLILSYDCVDVYNPKVVRSTMGAIFRVPVYVSENLATDIDILKQKGICIYGTHLSGTEFYDEKFSSPSAFLIGNEGNGLSAEISAKADKLIKIPMLGNVESLNAATTVAVVGYEVLRQRR
jgi:TrmH family RNA methyltransferase